MGRFVGVLVALAVLSVGFGVLERLFGSGARRARWGTDLAWFAFGAAVDPLVRTCVIASPVLWAVAVGRDPHELRHGHGPLAELPWGLQLLGTLLVIDALGYVSHRLHHATDLWKLHAVHHSSEHLDWLAAARVHPLNELVQRAPGAFVVVAMGFDLEVVAAVGPLLTLFAIGLHADLPWRLGPLRYLIATPVFHRWHHAVRTPDPRGVNFAGLFPVWDLLGGTFYVPDHLPERFGVEGAPLPTSFWRQLAWPMRGPRTG